MSDLPEPRDDLVGFAPYRTQQMEADVRLNANEWPEENRAGTWLTPGELDGVLLNRYPAAARDLSGALASRYGVSPEQLVLGNGSNEVLLNTFLVFGGHGRATLLFQPTYSMHRRLAVIAGGPVVDELIGLPYEVSPERALAAVERARPKIVVFTTPNNPTGNEIDPTVIRAVAEAHPRMLVLVDEAYSDFAGTTNLPLAREHPNIVISKTFSKACAAAGLRLGVVIADRRVADMYRAVQLPYNVSALTHAIAARIVADDAAVERRLRRNASERSRVFDALSRVATVEVFPSVTNFVMFRLRHGESGAAHARFLKHGVLIRDISDWPACRGCLRVTIGTPPENDRFIAAIPSALAA